MSKLTVLSLNCWSALLYAPLMEFLEKMSSSVDVFCLQEVNSSSDPELVEYHDESGKRPIRANFLQELEKVFADAFTVYYAPMVHTDHGVPTIQFGLVTIIRKGLEVEKVCSEFVHREYGPYDGTSDVPRLVQSAFLKGVTVSNFHGIPGSGKLDTDARISQSEKLLSVLVNQDGKKILVGDFNLLPETQSLKMIENADFRDLISEYGITNTRSSHYKKSALTYADYAFVTPDITVTKFEVLPDEVSDHLPLLLELSY